MAGSSGENLDKNESDSWQKVDNQACTRLQRDAENSCQCSQT